MSIFDQQTFFKAIYDDTEENLIVYLKENFLEIPISSKEQLLNTIMQRKKWQVLDVLIDNEWINTDLFEYDSFEDRQLNPLLVQTKYFNEQELADYMPHFEKFLDAVDDINEELAGYNLLSFALNNGLPKEIVNSLLQRGIKTDYYSRADQNYLHIALSQRQNRNSDYSFAISKLLIENGIDVNKKDIEGKTPLYVAIENNYIIKANTIQLLLENGADVNAEDTKGITPLFFATVYSRNFEVAKLLLQYGTPDFTKLNKDGENLLNAFLKYAQPSSADQEMLLTLIENGASLLHTSKYYDREKSGMDWIIEKPSDFMKTLLDKDLVDVNDIDNNGQTMLIKVCKINPNYEESVAKDMYKKVRYLLKAGAEKNIEDRFQKKAIDYAMEDNMKVKIVETLLEK